MAHEPPPPVDLVLVDPVHLGLVHMELVLADLVLADLVLADLVLADLVLADLVLVDLVPLRDVPLLVADVFKLLVVPPRQLSGDHVVLLVGLLEVSTVLEAFLVLTVTPLPLCCFLLVFSTSNVR